MKIKYYLVLLVSVLFISCAGAPKKGDVYLDLSLPVINHFHISPQYEEVKNKLGFLGFAMGMDYYHANNQFINLGAAVITDFPLMIPVSLSPQTKGESEGFLAVHASISNNHIIGKFKLGYGLSYARNNWNYYNYDTDYSVQKEHNAFGFIFPAYFQATNFFNVGLIYLPTFFRPGISDPFLYEHLMSVNLAFKVPLYRKRNNF